MTDGENAPERTEAEKIVEDLRERTVDWDNSWMKDDEEPRRPPDCGDLRNAAGMIVHQADIIAKQEAEIAAARAGLEQSDAWLTDTNIRLEKAEAALVAAETRERKLREENIEREAELIYLRAHGKDGAVWWANESKDVWREKARAAITDTASAGSGK